MSRIKMRLPLTDEQVKALQPLYKQALERYDHFCIVCEPFALPGCGEWGMKFTVISDQEADQLKIAMENLKAGDTE